MLLGFALLPVGHAQAEPGWRQSLQRRMISLDRAYPGELGLYVKDLASGDEFSHFADRSWYLASGVKVPIAIEVLRQIERGRFTLDSLVRLGESDVVDGAGGTNGHLPGSLLTVRYLFEQMLIYSDNTASDVLIGLCGLPQINSEVQTWAPGFSSITRLADVRRQAYSGVYTQATQLTSADLIALRNTHGEPAKLDILADVLHVPRGDFNRTTLRNAFEAYYATGLNSASLRDYGSLLGEIAGGALLQPVNTRYLLQVMARAATGKKRIQGALPPSYLFAHKTGTQYARFCDFGIAWPKNRTSSEGVVIAACSRGETSSRKAERALRAVGEAITASGLMK